MTNTLTDSRRLLGVVGFLMKAAVLACALALVGGLVLTGAFSYSEETRDSFSDHEKEAIAREFFHPKISPDLQRQLVDKRLDQIDPGYYARTRGLTYAAGIDNRRSGVLLHFAEYPSVEQLKELENLGAEISKNSWIPESPPDYTGFLYARVPLDQVTEIAKLAYVSWLSDGETIGTQVPELKSMLAEKERLNPYKHPHIDAILLQLGAVARERSLEHAADWATNRGLRVSEDRVNVEIISKTDEPMPVGDVAAMGGEIDATWRGQHSAWLPILRLLSIADQLNGSYYIGRPNEPVADQVVSEAVAATGADDYHGEGWDGTGVTVGIIDGGFTGWTAAVGNGDLPAGATTTAYGGQPFEAGGDHGTNCAEVAFDIAPGATYRVYRIINDTHLGNAVTDGLANGVNVFSHSMSWFNTGWHDGDGAPCAAANAASAGAALFVTSAGNRAQQHWQGNLTDGDLDGFHEWPGPDEFNRIPAQAGFGIPNGATFSIFLQWNVDGGDIDNYDLSLYTAPGGAPVLVSANAGENFEQITATNTSGGPLAVWFAVERISGDGDFEIMETPFNIEYSNAVNSTTSPSNATGANVVSVAAVTVGDFTLANPAIAAYSGQGPTNDGTPVPHITGPTDVSTFSNFPGTFGGTSCATPNVAGAAAARWSSDPLNETAATVQTYLYGRALARRDWGPAGRDNTYGQGGLILEITPVIAIRRGLDWLRTVQNGDGSWAYADGMGTGNVGVTALAAVAFINDGANPTTPGGVVDRALNWVLGQQDPADGFFSNDFYKVYNTSLAIWALAAAMSVNPDPDPQPWVNAVSDGKDYLLGVQWLSVGASDWQYGGLGYNASLRPDLSNHQMAVLGLKAADLVLSWQWPDGVVSKDAAIEFISRCQNSPTLNPNFSPSPVYVPGDEGGFIYQPFGGSIWTAYGGGHSYGSMTGAGMWSLYCCGLDNTDSRIEAAKDWIFAQTDYHAQNPGVVAAWEGPERFYYYYAMTAMKAFTMLWHSQDVDGNTWYENFSGELIGRQDTEGWWQGITNEPRVFATAEAITALETWSTVLTGDARWDLSSDADLIVYDPDGNRCWIDYEMGVVECNIPGAVCSGPHPSVITINAPQAGGYTTQVVGREYGWYRLTISSHLNGTTVSSGSHWGWTHEGETDEWSTIIATVFHPMTLETNFPPVYPPEPSTVFIPNTEECVNPGEHVCLPILLDNNTTPFGGFELEVEFDYTSMTFVGAEPGELIEGFEKFTYRLLPCPACGCCKYKILLYGQYDMPNGVENVGDPIPLTPIREYATLVNLCFVVNNDENLRGLKIPVCFEWEGEVVNDTLVEDWECGENTFSSWSGDTLFASNLLCQFNPEICDDPGDRIQPILIFQHGICGQNCGGVDVCAAGPGLCKRGDINMNDMTHEVADAVLFASYFVEGTSVFRYDEAYQICATDINADGRTLTLSDLVYLIRVILHDAVAIPKLTPSSEVANVIVSGGTISTECAAPIGAILFEFDGAVNPTLLADMEMVAKDNKVLVWSSKGMSFSTAEVLTFEGEAELVTVTAVDRDSRELTTAITGKVAPPTFALHPAYPNPFNPFTNLSFALPEAVNYSLRIYNVTGQLVRGYKDVGAVGLNMITWDSKDNTGVEVASGVYFYKLTAGGFSATEKMVILK